MVLISLDDLHDAAARIGAVVRNTPLVPASLPGEPPLWLKCENLQLAGAFKIRGAYNFMSRLPDAQRRRGVITYSSGNHGQGVALAARLLGAPAVIVMPTTAPAIKVDGARGFGAEVLFEGTTSLERKARAEREAQARGLTVVPPFDHPHIVAGQGTVGLEILDDAPDVRAVYVPIGGGGLAAGVAAAVKRRSPDVRVIGVEPVGASKMLASLREGRPVTLDRCESIADGLLPVRPGDLTFAHVQAYVDEIRTVTDAEIAAAVLWLLRHAHLVVEPSGAAAVAAVRRELEADPAEPSHRRVAILSGGNVSLETLVSLSGTPARDMPLG